MELTPQQLKANYDSLIAIIEENIETPRKEKLIKLYDSLSEHMIMAPASGNENYHLAFTGGYCIHVRNVVNAALLVTKVFKQMGGTIDFTKEELVFSALNHDLGKVGDGKESYYIWNESEWHRKNQGKMFEFNENVVNMSVTDRSLYLLQKAEIPVSQNEWIAIKTSDGMYDESNKEYLKTFQKGREVKNNLIYVIHWADHMSSRAEWDMKRNDNLSDLL